MHTRKDYGGLASLEWKTAFANIVWARVESQAYIKAKIYSSTTNPKQSNTKSGKGQSEGVRSCPTFKNSFGSLKQDSDEIEEQ